MQGDGVFSVQSINFVYSRKSFDRCVIGEFNLKDHIQSIYSNILSNIIKLKDL